MNELIFFPLLMFRYALQWESKNIIAVSTAIQDWLTSSNLSLNSYAVVTISQ